MGFSSSRTILPASGGPLTDMLAVLFPAQKAARFHFIGHRGCWLFSPSGEWLNLKAGDALLLPRGAEHVLASAPGVHAVPIERYSIQPLQDNVFNVSNGGRGPKTLLFCGSMHFNLGGSHPLLGMMPDMIRAHEHSRARWRLTFGFRRTLHRHRWRDTGKICCPGAHASGTAMADGRPDESVSGRRQTGL
jgi:hypothetical protein